MKKMFLMASIVIMILGMARESRAECADGTYACGSSCIANGQDCYIYNDNGKVSELILNNQTKMTFTYGSGVNASVYSNNGTGWAIDASYSANPLEDGTYMISSNTATGSSDMPAVIIDNKGHIKQSGRKFSHDSWYTKTTYAYDEETGERISRTLYNCTYGGFSSYNVIFNCTESATQDYTTVIDGNTIKEYVNGELVSVNNYSDAYMAKLKACPANTFSVGGECLPRRYSPAELAKIVGESNTILLYYK